jgi:hypothetical protein
MIVLPQNAFAVLTAPVKAQRLILPSTQKAKIKGTIPARHGAVNWKMGKLTRGGKVNFACEAE